MAATFAARCAATLALTLCTACASQQNSSQEQTVNNPAAADILATPAPSGVDAQLWKKLTAELARVVAAQPKRTSAVAEGRGSEVHDFLVYPAGAIDRMHWSYRNQGDYDLNGEVNISDLTPIAAHYMKRTSDATWAVDQFADGDGNGEVNISDVTPLGANLGARVLGYMIQEKSTGVGTEFEDQLFVPFAGGQPNSGVFPEFSLTYPNAQVLYKYRVVPSATAAAPYEYGVPSNAQTYTGETPHSPWEQRGGNTLRNSLSELNGPATATNTWSVDLQGSCFDFSGPVADRYGNIYCTSFTAVEENLPSLEGSTGSIWCVDRAGNVRWRFKNDDAILSQPVLLIDGTVAVQTYHNELIALYPDGKLHWRQQLLTDNDYISRQLTVDEDGILFALDSTPALRRIVYDGTILWTEPITISGNLDILAPVCTSQLIVVPSANNKVAAYLKTNGAFDGDVTLNANFGAGMMIEPSTTTLWVGLTGAQDLQAVPLDIGGNPADYTSAVGNSSTGPALNSVGQIVLGERIASAVPGEPDTGRVVGVDAQGNLVWDRPLAAVPSGVMACDAAKRVFVATYGDPDDTGFYGIDESHNVAWFVPTGGYSQGISIAGEGFCAGIYSDVQGSIALGNAFLMGIDED